MRTEQIQRSKIDLVNEQDAKYWLRHLGTTRENLDIAIQKVGNSADSVRKELARMSGQSRDLSADPS